MGKKTKKTAAQAREYRNNLGDYECSFDGTYITGNQLLSGSDDLTREIDEQMTSADRKIAKMPLDLRIKDWLNEHGINLLITLIIVPMIGWFLKNTIELMQKVAVYEYRIEALEEDLLDLSDTVPDKEKLELQLEIIKDEIENNNVSDIEERISVIEEEIQNIRDQLR